MKVCIYILLFSLLSLERQIIFVHEISRHGARSPQVPIPNNNCDDWPMGPMMLTPIEKRQHYILGRYYRDRYVNQMKLLDPEYNPNQIFVRSTGINRTILSAFSQMMGFYGFSNKTLTDDELPYAIPPLQLTIDPNIISRLGNQPMAYYQNRIPIHVFNHSNDSYYQDSCPYADAMLNYQFSISQDVKNILSSKQSSINKMLTIYGYDPDKISFDLMITIIFSVPLCQFDQRDCKLPNDVSIDINYLVITLWPYRQAINATLTQMRTTSLFKEMIQTYDYAIKSSISSLANRNALKGYFAFAHDDTLMTIGKSLKIPNILNNGIPLASSLIFEIHAQNDSPKNESDFTVDSYFNMKKIQIGNCPLDTCPYAVFKQAIQSTYINNSDILCRQPIKVRTDYIRDN